MVKKQVNDVIGVLEYIKDVEEKPISWKDKKTGEAKKAVLFVIGLKLNEKWYNIEANSKAKAEEVLKKLDSEESFKAGDSVKLYLEDKKGEGFWKVVSIVAQEKIPLSDDALIKKGEDLLDKKEEKPSVPPKGSVENYKSQQADVFELGMAKNNAAVLMSGDIGGAASPRFKEYWDIVNKLFREGKEKRKELLGY